jgi:hypothetical protein
VQALTLDQSGSGDVIRPAAAMRSRSSRVLPVRLSVAQEILVVNDFGELVFEQRAELFEQVLL